jgi:outer membrane biosynthesis protein TonB
MSLASILVVVCALLTPVARAWGAFPLAQEKEAVASPAQDPVPEKAAPPVEQPQPKNVPQVPAHKPAVKKAQSKKKPATSKKRTAKTAPPPTPEIETEKRVVRNGSAIDPTTQISPSVPPQQASSQIQNTNTLLSTADANLKTISGTQLNANQEDMVKQIRTYMEQAKAAASAGDSERASNLATKAQLLSAELVKK